MLLLSTKRGVLMYLDTVLEAVKLEKGSVNVMDRY